MVDDVVDVTAQRAGVDGRQAAPPLEEGRGIHAARVQGAQLGKRGPNPGPESVRAGLDAADDLAAVVAQLPVRHGLHGDNRMTRDT
jgi:hypothetical protein